MKAGYFLRAPSSTFATINFSILSIYSKPNNKISLSLNQLAAFSSSPCSVSTSLSSVTSHKPQILLFLRPSIYSATLSDLHNFNNWAKTSASSVGSFFVQTDNGPDSTLLLRELKWFLEDILDEDPSLILHENEGFSSKKVVKLRASMEEMYKLWRQRIEERRPFQYIVGCEHWRDLVLGVEEGVLIPRPETEKIVDLVGDVVRECEMLKQGLWADLGTGSGALAVGIARVLGENGRVIATDLSTTAVAVAKYNVERYGLQDVISVKQGSWFDRMMNVEGEVAGIVSNPPYIPSKDINGLQAEVGRHEPRLALDGGVEGMDHLLHLCLKTSTMLKPGGFFAFETNGEKQSNLLADYMENATRSSSCFRDVNIVPDFDGILRFVTGYRK